LVRDLPEINSFGEILLKGIKDGADRRRTASMTDQNSSAELKNVSLGHRLPSIIYSRHLDKYSCLVLTQIHYFVTHILFRWAQLLVIYHLAD